MILKRYSRVLDTATQPSLLLTAAESANKAKKLERHEQHCQICLINRIINYREIVSLAADESHRISASSRLFEATANTLSPQGRKLSNGKACGEMKKFQ